MPLSVVLEGRCGDETGTGLPSQSTINPARDVMNAPTKDFPFAFRPSVTTDTLRPVLLIAGTQVMVALLGSVLITNGLLA